MLVRTEAGSLPFRYTRVMGRNMRHLAEKPASYNSVTDLVAAMQMHKVLGAVGVFALACVGATGAVAAGLVRSGGEAATVEIPGFEAEAILCIEQVESTSVKGDTLFMGRATVLVDQPRLYWRIEYKDQGQKWVCYHDGMVVEKPYCANCTNAWYIVSEAWHGCPIDADYDVRLLWFTYCARDVLKQRAGSPVPLPWGSSRHEPWVHACRLKAHWRTDRDVAPENAVFVFDPETYVQALDALSFESTQHTVAHRRAAFQQFLLGHTNNQIVARFDVEEWIEAGGQGIPLRWRGELYWFGRPVLRSRGSTTSVRLTGKKNAGCDIEKVARITDKRVRLASLGMDSVIYEVEDGVIPPRAVALQRALAGQDRGSVPPVNTRDPAKVRTWFVVSLIGWAACLTLLWAHVRGHRVATKS